MKKLDNIKLIIFDLDGTLVDSAKDISNALSHAVKPFGLGTITVEETASLVGDGLTRLVEKFIAAHNEFAKYREQVESIKNKLLEDFISYYSKHLTDFTVPYPFVREILEKLNGYKKTVISNKREALVKEILEHFGILNFFDVVLGGDSFEEKKPSPVPIRKVLEMFALNPEEAAIVGDSELDIQAGKAAGIATIAAAYGYRSKEFLKEADYIIDSIDELTEILNPKL